MARHHISPCANSKEAMRRAINEDRKRLEFQKKIIKGLVAQARKGNTEAIGALLLLKRQKVPGAREALKEFE